MTKIGVEKLSELTAALIWQKYKNIYAFDKTLSFELLRQPLDGEIPEQALYRLPYPCIFIDAPVITGNTTSQGFFAWLEWDVNAKMKELRLLYLLNNGKTLSVPIIIKGTLDQSFKEIDLSASLRMELMPKHYAPAVLKDIVDTGIISNETISGSINHVLYLCSDEPDAVPDTELRSRRTYHPDGKAKRPAIIPVGTRIGAALRQNTEPAYPLD
jgi:hypothetical protein